MSKPPILEALREVIVLANRADVLIREALEAAENLDPPSENWEDAAREWLEAT